MKRNGRRHGGRDEEANTVSSPLGEGWPSLTFSYTRTSDDLAEPPLVHGRYPLRNEACVLCSLAEDLADRGYSPESAAWAESDLFGALYDDEKPEDILEGLLRSYGLEVSDDDLQRHVEQHLPSSGLQSLARMRRWSPKEYTDACWRTIFDTLYLVVERTRQDVASGRIRPTLSEGTAAAKALSELQMAAGAEEDESNEDAALQMRIFVAHVQQAIEDTVGDESVKQSLYERVHDLLEERGVSEESQG